MEVFHTVAHADSNQDCHLKPSEVESAKVGRSEELAVLALVRNVLPHSDPCPSSRQ